MQIERVGDRSIVFTYPVSGWDLNVHLILGMKYNYLIDTGLGSLSIAPVKEYLHGNSNPLIVINTHHHWDHVSGNHAFEGYTIVSHSLCRKRIQDKWDVMVERNGRYMAGEAILYLPNLVFEDTLYFPEDKIKLFHTPGHTLDSISVLDEEDGILNAGDNVGDTMEEIVPSLETEKAVYANTISKYKDMDIRFCISGHNKICSHDVFDMILKRLQ